MNPVIIFDYDGVVADSFEVYFAQYCWACDKLGLRCLKTKEAFLRIYEGDRLERILLAVFPTWLLRKLARKLAPRIQEAAKRLRPFDSMPEILCELAQRYPVYIVTSNTTESTNWFLRTYGIEGVRDVLGVDKETSKVKKIRRVIRQHPDLTPYYIGDTKVDMWEARRAGAVPVAATWGWHPAAKLLEGRPKHVLESPAMLRAFFASE